MAGGKLSGGVAAVKQSIASGSYTANTVDELRRLLGDGEAQAKRKPPSAISKPKIGAVASKAPQSALKQTAGKSVKSGVKEIHGDIEPLLNQRDRYRLATEVVNAALQNLTWSIKKRADRQPILRNSHGSSPPKSRTLQPLSPNQRSVPRAVKSVRQCDPSIKTVPEDRNENAVAACASIAFAVLRRQLQAGTEKTDEQILRLNQGTYSLVSKLIALEMDREALKELHVLLQSYGDAKGKPATRISKAEVTESRSGSSSTSNYFSEMLLVRHVPDGTETLEILILAQIQTIKLASRSQSLSTVTSVLDLLLDASTRHVVSLLEATVRTHKDTAARFQKHIDHLSQTIHSLVDSVFRLQQAATRKSTSEHCSRVVQGRLLELRLRSRSWSLTGGKVDAEKHLLHPLGSCLAQVSRSSGECQQSDYEQLATNIEALLGSLQALPKEVLDVRELKAARALAWRGLANVSRELKDFDTAVFWIEKSLIDARSGGVSGCVCAAVKCQHASLRLQSRSRKIDDEATRRSIEEATEALTGRLQGSSTDMDDLLVAASSLRKYSLSYLLDEGAKAKVENSAPRSKWFTPCKVFVAGMPRFLNRVLELRGLQDSEAQSHADPHPGLQLIAQIARPAIDAVCALAKPVLAGDEDSDNAVVTCLSDAAALALRLEGLLTAQSPKMSIPVNISNALWSWYLQKRRQNSKPEELQLLLHQSIQVLKGRCTEERVAGLLPTKHEKLANLFELLGDQPQAAEQYKKALYAKVQLDPPATSTVPRSQSSCGKSSKELMRSYLRSQAKVEASKSSTLSPLSPSDIDEPHQLQILELQLSVTVESFSSSDPITVDGQYYNELYMALSKLCDNAKSTMSQLEMDLQMLHMAYLAPVSFPSKLLDRLLETAQPSWVGTVQDHMLSQREVYRIMLTQPENISLMQPILEQWSRQLLGSQTSQDVCTDTGFTRWLSQLKLIEAFLSLYGNTELHALALQILTAIYSSTTVYDPFEVASHSTTLGIQLTKLGQITAAGHHFLKAQSVISNQVQSGLHPIRFYVSYAGFQLSLGNLAKCEALLFQAKALLDSSSTFNRPQNGSLPTKYELTVGTSHWFHQHSQLALTHGDYGLALYCARKSSKLAYRAWALFERQSVHSDTVREPRNSEDSGVSGIDLCVSTRHETLKNAHYWQLVPLLFEHTILLVLLLLRSGLLLEAQHYAEQAGRVAKASQSNQYMVEIAIINADIQSSLQNAKKGLSELDGHSDRCKTLTFSEQARFQLAVARAEHSAGDYGAEAQVLKAMEIVLHQSSTSLPELDKGLSSDLSVIEEGMKALTVGIATGSTNPDKQRAAGRSKKNVSSAKAASESRSAIGSAIPPSDQLLKARLHGERLKQSCLLAIKLGDLNLAASLLKEAVTSLRPSPSDVVPHRVCGAELCLRQGENQLAKDPVFSLLQESAIMLPSALPSSDCKIEGVTEKVTKLTSVGKGGASKTKKKTTSAVLPEVQRHELTESITPLSSCTDTLIHSASSVQSGFSTSINHRFSDILFRAQLLLSTTEASMCSGPHGPTIAAWAFEHGRSVAYAREKASIAADRLLQLNRDPSTSIIPELPLFDTPHFDAAQFQRDFVDIIPATWTAISIALSEDQTELQISRLRSQIQPLTLAIPLDRHNPGDCDEEAFGITEGKAELLDIIALANFSAHDTGDLSQKGAKTAWWEARAALDARLKDLMTNIQNMWLGGFRGLFSQHLPVQQLLSRFQQNLTNILNKHLPSRRKTGRGAKTTHVILDLQVIELFVGLGDPGLHEDIDGTLMDLYYFIVDILQFRGERNAYDEIDFDPMIVETIDALTQYHNAVKQSEEPCLSPHTILILDKSLHSFPWESMPFLQGQAISRLPSLLALRERIEAMRAQPGDPGASQTSFCANRDDGAYVLNPSSDLSSTHKTFQGPLSSLTSWDVTINSLPTEPEIAGYLKEKSIYLYFGHGSGGQYIRSRAIRRLPRCAVSLLMGCSSVAMNEAGKLESYGTPLTYLHAGAPAVVGTLWDVTDKDIDRYSMDLLKRWGLLAPESPGSPVKRGRKGKTKAKGSGSAPPDAPTATVSLDKAVAEARNCCILRYLNGAAPVVYGIPVVLK